MSAPLFFRRGYMSMKKAGITIFTLIMMVIIILLTVRGCSFSKKSEENVPQNSHPEVVLQGEDSNSDKEAIDNNGYKNQVQNTEKSPSKGENTVVEEDKNAEIEKVEEVEEVENAKGEKSQSVFAEIDEPSLGGNNSVNALVSSKKSYLVDGKSYAYSLSIVMPGKDNYNIVNYYCPKKTYDAVSAGDSVKVDYQVDKNGAISINFISK